MKQKGIVAHINDNVGTAIKDLKEGEKITVDLNDEKVEVEITQDIEFGHKFAIKDIKNGEDVLKYGQVIGGATEDIASGKHVHIHNIESKRGRGDLNK